MSARISVFKQKANSRAAWNGSKQSGEPLLWIINSHAKVTEQRRGFGLYILSASWQPPLWFAL